MSCKPCLQAELDRVGSAQRVLGLMLFDCDEIQVKRVRMVLKPPRLECCLPAQEVALEIDGLQLAWEAVSRIWNKVIVLPVAATVLVHTVVVQLNDLAELPWSGVDAKKLGVRLTELVNDLTLLDPTGGIQTYKCWIHCKTHIEQLKVHACSVARLVERRACRDGTALLLTSARNT